MNRKTRGLALIFNQEYFEVNMSTRRGTRVDRNNLEKTLTGLGFEVLCYNDYTKAKVLSEITKAATADHSEADCFLLAFMSHGEDENVYASDGQISIRDITAMFKGTVCPSLAGKPKIFIWQACRGREFDDPVTACSSTESEENEVEAGAVQTLPAGADFIMCYSVAEGYFSIRDIFFGSWFIQDLCEVLQQFGDSREFVDLLTLVNRKVSMKSAKKPKDPNATVKQMPCFASMLTKQLYFHPKK
ncbi:hypothetical protein Q5P01_025714 [Channa striata]|uniref:Caspase-6 n=1 Tax=Channa striata TaxID=64152 RepID=A0AA88IRC3_CHASR|nr:hypothetical protein Q5P01_025714 [Channa striata]